MKSIKDTYEREFRKIITTPCGSITYYTTYSPGADISYIMREESDAEKTEISVVGFYYGEPEERLSDLYIGQTTASIHTFFHDYSDGIEF